jgi:energy-coupling factor transporter ATP-binding protein EcfA2
MSHNGHGRDTVYASAEMREFLANSLEGKSNEWIREFAGLIDDKATLDWLNLYCGIYEERGQNFLDTHVARQVVRSAATTMTDEAFREGNVSQLKGAVGLTNSGQDGGEAIMDAARRLADEGAIYLVLGPPGSGKTAFALDVMRATGAITGGKIQANLDWDGADEQCSTSREMLDGMANHDGPVFQLIDEAGQSLTSKGAEQQVSDQFVKSLKYIRKREDGDRYPKRGSVLLIGHTEKDTAAEIRRLASGAFVKTSRQDPGRVVFKESEGGADRLEQVAEYKGVTDTRERYNEHEASHFEVVLDDVDESEDTGPTADDVRRQEAIATTIRLCQPWGDDGHSYSEAAEIVGYSDSWVGDRVREWRRGDHRDLVAGPDAESE